MVVYFSLLSDRPTDKETRRCEGRACRTEKAIAITLLQWLQVHHWYTPTNPQRTSASPHLKVANESKPWESNFVISWAHILFLVDFGHTFTLALSSFVLFLPSFHLFVFVLVFVLFSLFFLSFFLVLVLDFCLFLFVCFLISYFYHLLVVISKSLNITFTLTPSKFVPLQIIIYETWTAIAFVFREINLALLVLCLSLSINTHLLPLH